MTRQNGRRLRVALAATVATICLASTAMAVDVSGTLRVPSGFGGDAPSPALRDHYWDEWNGVTQPTKRPFNPARELSVVLLGSGPLAEDQPEFRIQNGGLFPRTMAIRAGENLSIRNLDVCSHQLAAQGLPTFTAVATASNLTRQVEGLGEAGDWPVRDVLYAHITGHLHVLSNLVARAEIRRDGSYVFRNVPPGQYELKVLHLGQELASSSSVTVTESRNDEMTLEPIALSAPGS